MGGILEKTYEYYRQCRHRHWELSSIVTKFRTLTIVCIMTGHMTLRLFIPRALEMLDLYTDPVALKWEARFIDYFV